MSNLQHVYLVFQRPADPYCGPNLVAVYQTRENAAKHAAAEYDLYVEEEELADSL